MAMGLNDKSSNWLDECESIYSDAEEDMEELCADSFPESESSEDGECSDEELENSSRLKFYYGKNRFKWAKEPPNLRTRRSKLSVLLPGLKARARQIGNSCNELEAWKLIFTDSIIQKILQRTNEKIAVMKTKYANQDRPELQNVKETELLAFFGLLYYTAIFKSNHEDLASLFATDGTGRDVFRAVMSLQRMRILLTALRFDDASDREERIKDDPAAPIREIFEKMVKNCQEVYSIGSATCIDEMLLGFNGRCKFKVYMPAKPEKYGLKIMILCDARTHYLYNAYIYTGKDSDGEGLPEEDKKALTKPTQSVLRLAYPLFGTNRNITADNWFSSMELIKILKTNGLTYVGTLRKNKRDIPPEFLPRKNRTVESSLYGFTKDFTMVSYVPKRNKAVILISSMHHSIKNSETGKPEIIEFYNSTKGGVDTLDQKCVNYCTNRRTRRWPMAIFFCMLNIAGTNAHVIFTSYRDNEQKSRFQYIKNLAKQLIMPHLNERIVNERLPRDVRTLISRILSVPVPNPIKNEVSLNKRKRCGICPRALNKESRNFCSSCDRPMCADCRSMNCKDCENS